MSDSSLTIAQSAVTARAAATQQALQTQMLRQQADSDQAVVEMLQQASEQQKATLPAGQGNSVDILA